MSKYISLNLQLRTLLMELKHLYSLFEKSEAEMESKKLEFVRLSALLENGKCPEADFNKATLDFVDKCDATSLLAEDYLMQEDYVKSFLTCNAEELGIPSTVHIVVCKAEVQFWKERDFSLEEKILGEH